MFKQTPAALAKALMGQTLRIGHRVAEILEAQGYAKRDNEQGIYKPILELNPGQVFCPQFRTGILVLVACYDRGEEPGGCVLIRKVKVDGKVVSGPGRVAEALGITESGTYGRMSETQDGLSLKLD
jgi:3-methyladenine DNA glycosylase Mpg